MVYVPFCRPVKVAPDPAVAVRCTAEPSAPVPSSVSSVPVLKPVGVIVTEAAHVCGTAPKGGTVKFALLGLAAWDVGLKTTPTLLGVTVYAPLGTPLKL